MDDTRRGHPPPVERAARQGAELKANIARRKAQAEARRQAGHPPHRAPEPEERQEG